MAQKKVLITGANGHLGFRIVVSALEAGYSVRAVVRREEAANQIRSAQSVQPYLSSLDIVLIGDLLKDCAFDDAVVGMDALIHVASPLTKPLLEGETELMIQLRRPDQIPYTPISRVLYSSDGEQTENYNDDIIQPAREMTMSVLKSAAKTSTIKRVVITSSVVVLDIGRNRILGAKDLGLIPDPHTIKSPHEAYRASKRIARAESIAFVSHTKPGFALINVLPSVILGYNELTTSTSSMALAGTNRFVVGIISGISQTATPIGATVHVNDCAEIHVRALDLAIKGNQDFITHASTINWNDGSIPRIARENFPKEVQSGVVRLGGELTGEAVSFDASETEMVFGMKWIGFEEQVKSIIGQYVELKETEELLK